MVDRTELSGSNVRRGRSRHPITIFLLVSTFILNSVCGFAVDRDYAQDIAESWRVGFATLRTRDLPPELGYLQFSLAGLPDPRRCPEC